MNPKQMKLHNMKQLIGFQKCGTVASAKDGVWVTSAVPPLGRCGLVHAYRVGSLMCEIGKSASRPRLGRDINSASSGVDTGTLGHPFGKEPQFAESLPGVWSVGAGG